MEREYPFYVHQEDSDDVAAEFKIIIAKPEGERIDEEALNIIRARLADRLEAQWIDPKEQFTEKDSTEIVETLRKGGQVPDYTEIRQALAQLLQDYRLSSDDKDKVKENILEIKQKSA